MPRAVRGCGSLWSGHTLSSVLSEKYSLLHCRPNAPVWSGPRSGLHLHYKINNRHFTKKKRRIIILEQEYFVFSQLQFFRNLAFTSITLLDNFFVTKRTKDHRQVNTMTKKYDHESLNDILQIVRIEKFVATFGTT